MLYIIWIIVIIFGFIDGSFLGGILAIILPPLVILMLQPDSPEVKAKEQAQKQAKRDRVKARRQAIIDWFLYEDITE
jgi:hypothetical protein